ncbi:hypothetical protein KAR91_02885 [Candidatus Pacearchaeota archaeon]|nr:hypothetical protein [Candidatus Pacearchaeota archaeon]
MKEEILKLMEQLKGEISPENIKKVQDNLDAMPEEAKQRLLNQFQNAVHLKGLINEYDDQRSAVLKDAQEQFKAIEGKVEQKYKEAYKQAEEKEEIESQKNAEEALKQI